MSCEYKAQAAPNKAKHPFERPSGYDKKTWGKVLECNKNYSNPETLTKKDGCEKKMR